MVWGLLAVCVVVGGAAVVLGVRGRRVGKRPHCGWCNRPVAAEGGAGSSPGLCAACGGSLLVKGGTRAGRWRRGWVCIVAGSMALVFAAALTYVVMNATDPAFLRRLPLNALVFQARHTGSAARDAALREILRRHEDTPLGQGTLRALADPAMEVMADTQAGWEQSPWFGVLDAMFAKGSVSEPDRARYVRLVLGEMEASIPERVLARDTLRLRRYWTIPRPRGKPVVLPSGPVLYGAAVASATLDGEPLPLDAEPGVRGSSTLAYGSYESWEVAGRGWRSSRGQLPVDFSCPWFVPFTLEPGTHTLTIRWSMYAAVEEFETVFGTRNADPGSGANAGRVRVPLERFPLRWELETTHEITAPPSPADLIVPVTSADGYEIDAAGITAQIEIRTVLEARHDGSIREAVRADLIFRRTVTSADERAVPIVGRVELRSGEQVWPLYKASPETPVSEADPVYVALVDGYDDTRASLRRFPDLPRSLRQVDVVIIPDKGYAAKIRSGAERLSRIWGEEVVIPDVPLDWPKLEKAVEIVSPPGP